MRRFIAEEELLLVVEGCDDLTGLFFGWLLRLNIDRIALDSFCKGDFSLTETALVEDLR